ncbi:MAG: polyprenyl diphosphate synthase [Verrucomicrobia bacterium]|nr:polyprenyl diphosphate synthase [Verrucomicrobiota bacterium]MDA1048289.1 polyprenyl diphosphate synthase [Verrucomicrobiota bacterium]
MPPIEEDSRGKVPRHVAIIMDGNGRWARDQGKPRLFGHHKGVENVRRVVDAAKEAGVPYLTLYAFSVENQNRPPDEVTGLMRLLREFLKKEMRDMVKDGVRLRTIGDVSGLPEYAQNIVKEAVEKTKNNDAWNLTLALNYGSRQETLHAVRAYAEKVASGKASAEELDWDTFSSHLYTVDLPDPDLIIRTSGEHRLSNFLLLQAAYAEIYVTPEPWPEFTADKFHLALQDYAGRERRYGKTGDQIRLKPTISETPVSV